jgi:flagellar protein FliL
MAGKKKAEPAAEAPPPEEVNGLEEVEAAPAPRFGKKQKIMAAAAAVLLLGGGGGAAALFMGGGEEHAAKDAHGDKAAEEEAAAKAEEEAAAEEEGGEGEGKGELPLVDVPAMIVNLRTPNGEARYLKLRFMIEARNASKVDAVTKKLPAIIDSFQPFLRELRPEDLAGSAAVYRIKEELLVRATAAVGAGMVKDILIQDLVQQ